MSISGGGDWGYGLGSVRVAPLTAADIESICARAASHGFDSTRIDLDGCATKQEFLARTAAALEFPAWFGGNWDALFDCLTDLSWRPAPGYVVIFENAADLQRVHPGTLATATGILEDVVEAWRARHASFRAFVGINAVRG
jgi:RNAse (barnase) inhibitor barstar